MYVVETLRILSNDFLPTQVQAFLFGLFESCNRNRRRTFYHHFTTAIDTQNMRRVFDDCKDAILAKSVGEILVA